MSGNKQLLKLIEKIQSGKKALGRKGYEVLCYELTYCEFYYAVKNYERAVCEYESSGKYYIQLFTDIEEYQKCYDESYEMEKSGIDEFIYNFHDLFEEIMDEDIIGVMINPNSLDFFLDRDVLEDIRYNYYMEFRYNLKDSLTANPKKLNKVKGQIKNPQLSDKKNKDELIDELTLSNLFVLCSGDNVGKSRKGVINLENESRYYDDGKYCYIFSDYETLKKTFDTMDLNGNFYSQILSFDYVTYWVLNHGLDGIILNNSIKIPRKKLLVSYDDMLRTVHIKNINNYSNYGLEID